MKAGLRNSMIGAVCLSMVGCTSMDADDVTSAGLIIGLVGIAAAVLLMDSDSDDDRHHHRDKPRDRENSYQGHHKCRDGRSCYKPR